MTGTGGAGCEHQSYFAPGCGGSATPTCDVGTGGACYSLACSCDGKIIAGCQREFLAPYAYTVPVSFDGGDPAGMICDPTANPNP